jgi:uncharacterized membrane protein
MRQLSWFRSKIIFPVICLVAISVCFRFANLQGKAYWGDEVYSSLRIFGYRTAQVHQAVAIGQPVPAPVLQQFQAPAPHAGVAETVQVLAHEDAHLTPLYFVLARVWADWFGPSAVALRSLSVLFSVLTLPVIYWLAIELFRNVVIARTAMVLAAVSPVYLVFAQEARFYSLWLLTTALSSAALLWAMRTQTWRSWGAFSLALVAMLYTQFLAVMTLVGYGLYVVLSTWQRDWRTLRRFILAAGVGVVAWLPWLWVFTQRQPEEVLFASQAPMQGIVVAIKGLLVLFTRAFVDFNWDVNPSHWQSFLRSLLMLPCLLVTLVAFGQLVRQSKRRSWLFLLLLMVITPLPVLPLSLRAELPSRYLLPSYLAIQLAIAYLFGNSFAKPLQACRWRSLWSAAMAFLVVIGVVSCASIVRAEGWWIKQYSSCNVQVAQLVNQSSRPLVVSDGDGGKTFDHPLSNILSLARLVKPDTQFQVFTERQLPPTIALGEGFSDRFLLTPSDQLLQKLEAQYPGQVKPEIAASETYRGKDYCLWRLPS